MRIQYPFRSMSVVQRDIPSLSVTILKEIAKTPAKYVYDDQFKKSQRIPCKGFDFTQVVVDYVIEAGRMTDDSLPLSIFANRTSLSLKNSKITPTYLSMILSRCPKLELLDLSGTFSIDDDCIQMVLRMCPFIRRLGLQSCRKLSNICLGHISTHSPLVGLQLGGNFNITADGIREYLQSPSVAHLQELSLAGLQLTDEIFNLIAKKCTQLRKLSFAYSNCTETALRTMLTHVGSQLESLSVAWIGSNFPDNATYQLTSDFIADFLPRHCPRLVELDVSGLKNVTSSTLANLIEVKYQQVLCEHLFYFAPSRILIFMIAD